MSRASQAHPSGPATDGGVAQPEIVRFAVFADLDWLVHGVSTRHGGVSPAPWDTLNLSFSVGDDPSRVRVNRSRFADALGLDPAAVAWVAQVHGADVVHVSSRPTEEPVGRADALISATPGCALAIRVADCVPVLIADPERRAVAAVHAGWRGTALGVAGQVVRALVERFGSAPGALRAVVGPSIGPCCYEVGPEVAERFARRPGLLHGGANGRPRLDLWAANRADLQAAGLPPDQIEVAGLCTRCHRDRFFSHRADGFPSGRFAAIIGIRD